MNSQLSKCSERIQQRARKRTIDHLADGRDYIIANKELNDEKSFREWVVAKTPHSIAQAKRLMRLAERFGEGLAMSGVPLKILELLVKEDDRTLTRARRALAKGCWSLKAARELLYELGILNEEDLQRIVHNRNRQTIKRFLSLLKAEGISADRYNFVAAIAKSIQTDAVATA